jgi:hypothetical protein
MERAKIIDPGFSTADAEYPKICQVDGEVLLRFKDWQERSIEVFFVDPIAFRWQMIETFIEGEAYDRSHVIENSAWLAEHRRQGAIGEKEEYQHYKFNFNGCGQFEVLSNGFRQST